MNENSGLDKWRGLIRHDTVKKNLAAVRRLAFGDCVPKLAGACCASFALATLAARGTHSGTALRHEEKYTDDEDDRHGTVCKYCAHVAHRVMDEIRSHRGLISRSRVPC